MAANQAIAELRKNLKEHPPVRSDELPLEVLMPLAEQLIVHSIKGGTTREQAQAALDELLLSAQYDTMTANTHQSG